MTVFNTNNKNEKKTSPTGNWTPVSRVTGGDTDHYTIEDLLILLVKIYFQMFFNLFSCSARLSLSSSPEPLTSGASGRPLTSPRTEIGFTSSTLIWYDVLTFKNSHYWRLDKFTMASLLVQGGRGGSRYQYILWALLSVLTGPNSTVQTV